MRAGLGLAILPCFQGDADPALERVTDPAAELETGLWLLTHPDLRRTARVRALTDLVYARLRAMESRLSGSGAPSAGLDRQGAEPQNSG